ncbi:hypothetical protein CLU79DRAFT_703276, partial [Phycomyces nitens]
IIGIVVPPGSQYVTRNEFNTALALVACAQKHMGKAPRNPWLSRPLAQSEPAPNHISEDIRPTTNPQELLRSRGINTSSTATTINNTMTSNKRPLVDKLPSDAHQWFSHVDRIRVELMEEKEGFLFRHANYKIESEKHGGSVLRRYSDFCWLSEMLLKRYPLRMLPTLPPKQVRGKDEVFLERRRKGLERFLSSVVRHPVLAKDELVAVFLTESSVLRTWLRSHTPLMEEEFMHQHLSFEEVERRIPDQLNLRLETLRKRLEPLTQLYYTLCSQMERMIRLEEAQAAEFDQYSTTLNTMCTLEQACYVPECLPCGFVVHGYESVSKHMQRAGQIQYDQTLVSRYTTLENLRRQRDLLISFKVKCNNSKQSIPFDSWFRKCWTTRVSAQQQRQTFVQYCLASEISFLHKHQAFVSQLYQNYAFEQIKYERQLSDNWKVLQVLASEMPSEPDDFA